MKQPATPAADTVLEGIAASPGIAIGKALVVEREHIPVKRLEIPAVARQAELERFRRAVGASKDQLLAIKQKLADDIGAEHAYIFDAHLMMLEDSAFLSMVEGHIIDQRANAEWALTRALEHYQSVFAAIDDAVIRERGSDVHDVGNRILRNLVGGRLEGLSDLAEDVIIVARDLAPSETAVMKKDRVRAFVTQVGGKTSHSAIMARALETPAVVGVENATGCIQTGDALIVDGIAGKVVARPSNKTFQRYLERQRRYKYFERELLRGIDLPAQTTDGYTIRLAANVELPEELTTVTLHGAAGIGLYRTEFLFMNRTSLPTEEEQYLVYRRLAEAMKPESVVIRTLDLGGDKFISHLPVADDMRNLAGLRAIRLCLERVDIFKAQLRAILRAGAHGSVKLLFPLISGVEEVRAAKAIVAEAAGELEREGLPFDRQLPIGTMIEVPSAALAADLLAREVDFFSIGSNDLIQYTLAIDRISEEVAYLYEPLHPAVLRLIKNATDVAHSEGIWAAVCGEMAADPVAAVILLGLGLDELSMNPVSIGRIKRLIRSVSFRDAAELAEQVLSCCTAREAQGLAKRRFGERLTAEFGAGVP